MWPCGCASNDTVDCMGGGAVGGHGWSSHACRHMADQSLSRAEVGVAIDVASGVGAGICCALVRMARKLSRPFWMSYFLGVRLVAW